MDDLKVLNFYNANNKNLVKSFNNNIDSSLNVKLDYNKVETDTNWIDKMTETIPYLDNILRNPNRFIVNEEDVVKIELARRITVESIKHLSRNTNFIQDYNKKTGDVRPSKILNINKEESFNTYENRFIYSLIKNMQFYIARKKSLGIKDPFCKDNKLLTYNGVTKVGKEHVNISLNLKSEKQETSKVKSLEEQIAELEIKIADLTRADVYKSIDKLHIALVTSPIKKTNMILKNVNFQYALSLWNYLQENIEDDSANIKEKKDYNDNGDLKKYIDETMMLNYLVMTSLNKEQQKEEINKEEIAEKLIANMVEKVLDVNETLNEEMLKNIVSKQYAVIKYKNVENDIELQRRFKKYLNEYIKKVSEAKLI